MQFIGALMLLFVAVAVAAMLLGVWNAFHGRTAWPYFFLATVIAFLAFIDPTAVLL